MKLISLDNLRTFKSKLKFGTLENDYYIAGVHEPDISKCKIAFPLNQESRDYSYNVDGSVVLFSTASYILIKELKEFLNLFASFSKEGSIYSAGYNGRFTYNNNEYTMVNSKISIESNGNLLFESIPGPLSLGSYELITNVYLVLSDSGEAAEK